MSIQSRDLKVQAAHAPGQLASFIRLEMVRLQPTCLSLCPPLLPVTVPINKGRKQKRF